MIENIWERLQKEDCSVWDDLKRIVSKEVGKELKWYGFHKPAGEFLHIETKVPINEGFDKYIFDEEPILNLNLKLCSEYDCNNGVVKKVLGNVMLEYMTPESEREYKPIIDFAISPIAEISIRRCFEKAYHKI